MIFVKTEAGQQALRERTGVLSMRQRTAFILFDGKRTLQQVLEATGAMGITEADVQLMLDAGLLEQVRPLAPARSSRALAPATLAVGGGEDDPTPSERYQAAYPIAVELTSSLGLRGFRLNLAVEGATGFDSLAALAPKIREAVGEARYERLEQALFA